MLLRGVRLLTAKRSRCFVCLSANPLLINSSMQPDLTVSRTYTSPMCFQDSIDKELMAEHSLLNPLPDLKIKGQRAVITHGNQPLLAWQELQNDEIFKGKHDKCAFILKIFQLVCDIMILMPILIQYTQKGMK